MIGIYKITKKSNGKSYIGQSVDIERRFKEHKYKKDIPIEIAIQKYGEDAFTYEIVEECELSELDKKESYWIDYYDSYNKGYNCNEGGGVFSGENNGRACLTEEEVTYIRECYNNHLRRKDVYEQFQDKITFNSFARIWDGSTWTHIKPEVYTQENKDYYSRHATDGEKSESAAFTNEEVSNLRKRYVNETARQIYPNVKERISYQGLQGILWGRSYENVPIYSKRYKRWINTNTCNDYPPEAE